MNDGTLLREVRAALDDVDCRGQHRRFARALLIRLEDEEPERLRAEALAASPHSWDTFGRCLNCETVRGSTAATMPCRHFEQGRDWDYFKKLAKEER